MYLISFYHEKSEKLQQAGFLGQNISAKVRDSRLFPIHYKMLYFQFFSPFRLIYDLMHAQKNMAVSCLQLLKFQKSEIVFISTSKGITEEI